MTERPLPDPLPGPPPDRPAPGGLDVLHVAPVMPVGRASVSARASRDRAPILFGGLLLLVVVALLGGLLAVVASGGGQGGTVGASAAAGSPSLAPGSFLLADPHPAPPIALIDPDGAAVTLASLRGVQVLVFFGYTHCPDVCPATIGVVGNVLSTVGPGTRAVFVTIDPERDTTTWLKEFVRYMPAGFTALTGTAAQIRGTADAWGVRYARVETNSKDGYAMSHTADVFLVDAAGMLRARFPFGTQPEPMAATIRTVAATPVAVPSTAPSSGPSAVAGPTPAPGSAQTALRPEIVSTSVWAGGGSPVIVRLNDAAGPIDDTAVHATVQLLRLDGSLVGPLLPATAVRPPGIGRVSYVATLDIPSPGPWRVRVTAFRGGSTESGETTLDALDPGSTAPLGAAAPTIRTPTVDDVGGDARAVTTDPQPDLRLSSRSTADLLASHTPFVLVVDSVKFRVSTACGKAVGMARYLADRWPDVAFVHLEPFRYTLVSETPVLSGDIANPPLVDAATAWGIGAGPWTALTVPWVFVVDGNGTVRAKYQGLMGSDDIDVVLAQIMGRTGQ